eukprot:scaffold310766_cov39-Prasinocladus_malaysianus.AAC.1
MSVLGTPAAVKLRFDIYVATAAERGYALEAWRILDPNAQLIPTDRVRRRVVCIPGGRQKKLEKVFNLRDNGPAPEWAPSPLPTAIILDDRTEVSLYVWQRRSSGKRWPFWLFSE